MNDFLCDFLFHSLLKLHAWRRFCMQSVRESGCDWWKHKSCVIERSERKWLQPKIKWNHQIERNCAKVYWIGSKCFIKKIVLYAINWIKCIWMIWPMVWPLQSHYRRLYLNILLVKFAIVDHVIVCGLNDFLSLSIQWQNHGFPR